MLTLVQTRRFIIVGVTAFGISLLFFMAALKGTSAAVASLIRIAVLLPVLYAGYSRWVLRDLMIHERQTHGVLRAEGRMAARVGASVGASIAVKLLLEPKVAASIADLWGSKRAFISPILADFVYGPAANYLVLSWLSKHNKRHSDRRA